MIKMCVFEILLKKLVFDDTICRLLWFLGTVLLLMVVKRIEKMQHERVAKDLTLRGRSLLSSEKKGQWDYFKQRT